MRFKGVYITRTCFRDGYQLKRHDDHLLFCLCCYQDVDETGRPTESFKNAIRSQLNNKEGFTISYDDKRSLEMIRTAAREIQTQLLHLDLPERHVMPRGLRIPSQVGEKRGDRSSNVRVRPPFSGEV